MVGESEGGVSWETEGSLECREGRKLVSFQEVVGQGESSKARLFFLQ